MARVAHAITPYTYQIIQYRGRSFHVLARESFSRHHVKEVGQSPILSFPDCLIKWCLSGNAMADEVGCTPYNHDAGRFVDRWWP